MNRPYQAASLAEWHEIRTQGDADALLRLVGDFHDGVLREAHLWTEHWVGEELGMAIGLGLDTRVRMLLQRQWRPVSAVELLFEQVLRVNIVPSPENYEGSIQAATLLVQSAGIYWAEEPGWAPGDADGDAVTWIGARRLCWRDASNWMGEQLRYGPGEAVPPSA